MGTTADKLTYLNNTKSLLKERLNSLGASITSSTTFRNYLTWLDTFYNNVSNKVDLAINGIQGRISQNSDPSPSSPQNINILTGNVTYKITTQNDEQTFVVPLGSIELGEIDTYKDKIYSNNNKFYIEKNIGKFVFNNTSVFAVDNTQSGEDKTSYNGTYSILKTNISSLVDNKSMYCTIAKYEYNSSITGNRDAQNNLNNNTMCMRQETNDRIYFKNSIFTGKTGTQIKSLINSEILYYVSATTTTTEITSNNYPELYATLKEIQDYLNKYKINNEFILDASSPEIEY